MKRIALTILTGMILLWGYTSLASAASVPSDDQARQAAEKLLEGFKGLGAKVIDFRKLNGESRELEGQKIYIYHYLVAVELPAGIAWVKDLLRAPGGGYIKDPGQSTDWLERVSLPKGTTVIARGQITFRLTERGWLPADRPGTADYSYCTQLQPEACYKDRGFDKSR